MIRIHRCCLDLINPFGIARGTQSKQHVVLANLDGGWGEGAPSAYYGETDATIAQALGYVDEALERVLGSRPDILDYAEDCAALVAGVVDRHAPHGTHPHSIFMPAAKAAFDIAVHDRIARRLGIPLHRLFGKAPGHPLVTSFTIGLDTMDEMLRKADEAKPYSVLKIKLGREIGFDLEVMRNIRRVVGEKTLRVDANGGWSPADAARALPVLADLGVEYVEQPLVKHSIAELRELKKNSPLPIFVDEDSMVAADLPPLAGAVDGINIKLMKSGGLGEALRMIAVARTLGFQIMVGCMIETAVGITAAAHLGPLVDYLDLDGNLLVSNDPFTGATCDPDGTMHLPTGPGLGVELRPERAAEFA